MSKAEGGDDPLIPLGDVNMTEFQLVMRGLDCLNKELLLEAAEFAQRKLSYQNKSLSEVAKLGLQRLEQARMANRLQERWKAIVAKYRP